MAKLTKISWLDEGLKVLNEFAQDKLKILYLCDRLKVTRGSFYHHFKSIGDYIDALMEYWVQKNTLDIIRSSNKGESPEEQMELLNLAVHQFDQRIETSIRSWSFYNEQVKKQLEKVDEIRINYTASIYENMGMTPDESMMKAKLEYATLIGLQLLEPGITPDEMDRLYQFYSQ